MEYSDNLTVLLYFQVGQQVGVDVQARFGKSILELGGNNAIIGMYMFGNFPTIWAPNCLYMLGD